MHKASKNLGLPSITTFLSWRFFIYHLKLWLNMSWPNLAWFWHRSCISFIWFHGVIDSIDRVCGLQCHCCFAGLCWLLDVNVNLCMLWNFCDTHSTTWILRYASGSIEWHTLHHVDITICMWLHRITFNIQIDFVRHTFSLGTCFSHCLTWKCACFW